MSQLNPFSASSSSSGVSSGTTNSLDQTMNDAMLGDQIMGGNTFGGSGSGSTDWLSSLAKAMNPSTAAAAQQPQVQADKAQSSPVESGSGTQSSTSPGQAPPQGGQGGSSGQPAQSQDAQGRAAAVPQLNALLNALTGKPEGPTWILPQVKPGETGSQSPVQSTTPIAKLINQLVGAQSADARLPPDQGGRDITVRPEAVTGDQFQKAAGLTPATLPAAPPAASTPSVAPTPQTPPLSGPSRAPTPGAVAAQPGQPGQSRLIRDLAGISQGNPMALADLALALYGIGAPLALAFGKGGRPGVDYASGYGEAQDMMNKEDARQGTLAGLRFNKDGKPAPGGAFDHNGAYVASPEKTPTSNQIPGVSAKIADDYIRQAATKYGIDPNTASKFLGAESAYGQNNLGDKDAQGRPTSFGPLQLHMAPGAMGAQFQRDTGQDPRNFAQNWKQQIDYALGKAAQAGWTPGWTTSMNKLGLNKWSGINRGSPPVSIRPEGTSPQVSFLTGG